MFLVWGAKQTVIYNDAYIPILGDRHPGALGKPFFSVWPEVREVIGPVIDAAFAGQECFSRTLRLPSTGRVDLSAPGSPSLTTRFSTTKARSLACSASAQRLQPVF
jgi:hypothetical protein